MASPSPLPANPLAARITALDVLTKADTNATHRIDDVLHHVLRGNKLSAVDRRLVTELVLGTTRLRDRLDLEIAGASARPLSKLEPLILRILRLGVYQLRELDSIPDYAAISTSVDLARFRKLHRATGYINGVLRKIQTKPALRLTGTAPSVADLAAYYSHPKWLVKRWSERYDPQDVTALMAWNNQRPKIWFLDLDHEDSSEAGGELDTSPHPDLPQYYSTTGANADLLNPESMTAARRLVQDPSSGAILAMLGVQSGDNVLDLCAAPGGKTAVLATLAGPEGVVAACEIDPQRVGRMHENVQRLALDNVQIYPGDARTITLPESRRILVDAPCSGTGVMSRRADLRWRRKPEHILELARLQTELLARAGELLSSGGVIVYATCTLEPEENWAVVEQFLTANDDFELLELPESIPAGWLDDRGALSTFPPRDKVDGVFAVRLGRK